MPNTPNPSAHPLENSLLSILNDAQTLRFVFTRKDDERLALALEGSGPNSENLANKIAILLEDSADETYWFEADSTVEDGDALGETNCIEIIPDSRIFLAVTDPRLGFEIPNTKEALTRAPLVIPSFDQDVNRPSLIEHPYSLILGTEAIHSVELEFTARSLDEAILESIEVALENQKEIFRSLHMGQIPANPTALYLALCLSRQRGWTVRLRAFISEDEPVPQSVLELIGQETFKTTCLVHDPRTGTLPASHRSRESLESFFPRGWNFAAILPHSGSAGNVHAEQIYNAHLPHLPKTGFTLGSNRDQEVKLPDEARPFHFYIVGATGTGKTTLLKRMIARDLDEKESLIVLDPHGDLHQEVVKIVPDHRREDLLVIDPTAKEKPIAFNILDHPKDEYAHRHSALVVDELLRFFQSNWNVPQAFGPVFELYFRNAILLLTNQDRPGACLSMFEQIFTDNLFRRDLISSCNDAKTIHFWKEVAENTKGESALSNVTPYVTSKVSILTQSGFVSEMIGQTRDALKLEERMNSGGIILVNLNKGILGEKESRLLGVLLTMQIFAAGLKRSSIPSAERKPVNIYIDEFQNIVSDNIASMLAEARKFGLRLTLANQTMSQLTASNGRQNLLEAVLGNVGNLAAFRLGVPDSERLKPFLQPFHPEEIQRLPNHQAIVRILGSEGPIGPMAIKTLPC